MSRIPLTPDYVRMEDQMQQAQSDMERANIFMDIEELNVAGRISLEQLQVLTMMYQYLSSGYIS